MIIEIITIIISILIIGIIYIARIKSVNGKTFLFSEKFLQKTDEKIFDFVKFIFKLYSLLFHNISTFVGQIPHKIIHTIHGLSHAVAQKSSVWVEKITHKSSKHKEK